jgi:hypothetical protein
LPWQPIFYPVLTYDYAEQIAREWNTKDEASGYAGFVTVFSMDRDYLKQFPERQVGTSTHREFWIPAELLDEFNCHICGLIALKAAFYGQNYKGQRFELAVPAPDEPQAG